jgi:hypothetical protein
MMGKPVALHWSHAAGPDVTDLMEISLQFGWVSARAVI